MAEVPIPRGRLLHITAILMTIAAAIGSLGRMLYTGRHNHSVLLMLLFAGWVLLPFLGLLLANRSSRRWQSPHPRNLFILMLVISIGSLISYSGILIPAGTKPAFIFLVVPLISWLLIAIITLPAISRSGKSKV